MPELVPKNPEIKPAMSKRFGVSSILMGNRLIITASKTTTPTKIEN